MKTIISFLLSLVFVNLSHAQVHNISSDYYHYDSTKRESKELDWTFLDEHIKDKRLVFLGEEDHKVSEFNFLKSNLITHLVQKKGFSVVLFESPAESAFWGFSDPQATPQSLKDSLFLFTIWTVAENEKLFRLLLDSTTGVTVGGFDAQNFMSSQTTKKYEQLPLAQIIRRREFLSNSLKSRIYTTDSTLFNLIKDNKNTYKVEWARKGYDYNSYKDTNAYNAFIVSVKYLQQDYRNQLALLPSKMTESEKLFPMYLRNRIWAIDQIIDPKRYVYSRDSIMAANIVYMADSIFAGKKLIIWAHDGHISKKPIKDPTRKSTTSYFLPPPLLKETYIIGLKMGTCLLHDGTLKPYPKNTSQRRFHQAFHPALGKLGSAYFTDLNPGVRRNSGIKGLFNYYDAVFYISEVHLPHWSPGKAKE